MMSFPFYLLPQDVIDCVTSEFVASIPDVARLDSATCCSNSRSMLLHSMRTVHCTKLLVGRNHYDSRWKGGDAKNVRSSLDWIVSRRFAISKLTVCPFGLLSWTPDAENEGVQIVVKTLEVLIDGATLDRIQALGRRSSGSEWWSQFRWSELEWSEAWSVLQSRSANAMKWLNELVVPILPVDQLAGVYFNRMERMVIDHTPSCFLSGSLRKITTTVTGDSLQNWMRIIEHNRSTLETLEITLNLLVEHESVFDDMDSLSSWPVLKSVTVCGDHTAAATINANRLISLLVDNADQIRVLHFVLRRVTSETAVSLLRHVIWRPRNYVVVISISANGVIDHPLPNCGSWVTDNPPETRWRRASDFVVNELWRYLPTEKQQFDEIVLDKLLPQSVHNSCLRNVSEVFGCHTVLTEHQWLTILRSPRLSQLEITGHRVELVSAVDILSREAQAGIFACDHKVRRIQIESEEVTHSPLWLPQLSILFGHSLQEAWIEGVSISFETMIQFARSCSKLRFLTIDYVEVPENVMMLKHDLAKQIPRQHTRADIALNIGLVWSTECIISWDDFVNAGNSTMLNLVWALLSNTFKHRVLAADSSAPKAMTLKLRFYEYPGADIEWMRQKHFT